MPVARSLNGFSILLFGGFALAFLQQILSHEKMLYRHKLLLDALKTLTKIRITHRKPPPRRATIGEMSHKKDAEPLKLMPLDEFGKLVAKIVQVPKDKIEAKKPKDKTRKRKPR
jgi:hypothetical protein